MAKDPKDENDPTRLRSFAQRIAQMKWWQDNPKSEDQAEREDQAEPEQQAEPEEQSEETPSKGQPDKSQDQQPPAGDEASSEGKTS